MKTASISTKWIVEIYPFENPVPSKGDFKTTSNFFKSSSVSIAGSKGSAGIIKDMTQKGILPANASIDNLGIVGVSIGRTKKDPDGNNNITLVGPLPDSMIPGSWVVISTASAYKDGLKYLMRFIGQIKSIDVTYRVDEAGLLSTMSNVSVREWSYALKIPVRYDILALQTNNQGEKEFLNNVASKAFNNAGTGQDNVATQLEDFMNKSLDPYEISQKVLQLIGAINADDAFTPVTTEQNDFKFPSVAIQMPSVPPAILTRLGIDADPKNPFSTGFVKTISGVQYYAVENEGDWDGIWNETKIDDFRNILKEGYERINIRPKMPGLGALLQSGMPAWDILNQFAESTLNEAFTDIWYEQSEDSPDIIGKPVIVLRDKPFLLKALRDNPPPELQSAFGNQPDLSKWTLYDDLPRLNIPSEYIMSFRLNNNIANSPNYIRVNYQLPGFADRISDTKAALAGIVRLSNEMERFGGQSAEAETSYISTNIQRDSNPTPTAPNNSTTYFEEYFGVIKGLFTLWHAYNYRMAAGTITLKDDNLPVSVGTNLQFEIGKFKLVCHVDSVEYTYQIDPSGLESTMATINFSRLVRVLKDNSLALISPQDFGSIPYKTPSEESITPNTLQGLDSLVNKIGSFV